MYQVRAGKVAFHLLARGSDARQRRWAMEDVKKSDEIKEMKEGSIGTTMGGTTMGGTTIRVPPSGVTAARIKEAVASGAPTTAPTPAPLASVRSFTAKKLHGVLPPPLFDGCHDFTPELTLKGDSAGRPLWVCPDGRIFLEVTSPVYKEACDFLVAIAEPRSRTRFMHEYELTDYSLYAGASLGLRTDDILSAMSQFSKTQARGRKQRKSIPLSSTPLLYPSPLPPLLYPFPLPLASTPGLYPWTLPLASTPGLYPLSN